MGIPQPPHIDATSLHQPTRNHLGYISFMSQIPQLLCCHLRYTLATSLLSTAHISHLHTSVTSDIPQAPRTYLRNLWVQKPRTHLGLPCYNLRYTSATLLLGTAYISLITTTYSTHQPPLPYLGHLSKLRPTSGILQPPRDTYEHTSSIP
jgi:hypothetical protein